MEPSPFISRSSEQWVLSILDYLRKREVPVEQWISAFNDGRTMTETFAQVVSDLQKEIVLMLNGMLLPSSFSEFLTALVVSFFRLQRKSALATQGIVLLENRRGPDYIIAPDDLLMGTAGNSVNTRLYRNLTGGALPAGKSLLVTIEALTVGPDYNVPNLAIVDLKTPKPGVVVSNPPIPGLGTWITRAGMEEEEDGTVSPPSGYKGRALGQWSTIGAGSTADAYRFWALAPIYDNASPATRAEPLTNYDPDTGKFRPNTVTVFVAGPAGPVAAPDVANIAKNFERPRRYPLGTSLLLRSAKAVAYRAAGTLFYRSSFTEEDVQAAVARALALYQKDFTIGSPVYASEVIRVVMGSLDDATVKFDLASMTDQPTGPGGIAVITQDIRFQRIAVMS